MDHRAQCSWFQNYFQRKIISSEIFFAYFHGKYTECYNRIKSKVDGPAKVGDSSIIMEKK